MMMRCGELVTDTLGHQVVWSFSGPLRLRPPTGLHYTPAHDNR